jgi:hypothetical protein
LEAPITLDELENAVLKGKNRKSPGTDGIVQEFYKHNWSIITHEILDEIRIMHTKGEVLQTQKQGTIVCLPKTTSPERPADYRALTVLNTDLKLMARVISKRLESILLHVIHSGQHCGVRGRTILEATAKIRDSIAYAEVTGTSMCILSLDLKDAFDNIAHTYLYEVLRAHGFSEVLIRQIRAMYDGATASVMINGHNSRPFPVRRGVKQGCPLAVLLYALALNPLLTMIDEALQGIRIRGQSTTAILA